MLEHTRHTSALTVAQKHNDTFLRNSTETKKQRFNLVLSQIRIQIQFY